jgi:sugar/nucleoside kinase (ribokinase family)
MSAPDFVAVGHVTLGQTETGTRPGGSALYAALTAHRLGYAVALLTSFGSDFPCSEVLPPEILVVNVPSSQTTTFRHEIGSKKRRLTLLGRAADLEASRLPTEWKRAGLAYLAPVANEVDPSLAAEFTEGAVGAGIQGWMRGRDREGLITPTLWEGADLVLPHVQAIFMSREDLGAFERDAVKHFERVPLAVVTLGAWGALLFVNGDRYEVRADPAEEVDATGAGDVFAAAFLLHYQRQGDPWEAAGWASCAAALSVEGTGVTGIPSREAVESRFRRYREHIGAEP